MNNLLNNYISYNGFHRSIEIVPITYIYFFGGTNVVLIKIKINNDYYIIIIVVYNNDFNHDFFLQTDVTNTTFVRFVTINVLNQTRLRENTITSYYKQI